MVAKVEHGQLQGCLEACCSLAEVMEPESALARAAAVRPRRSRATTLPPPRRRRACVPGPHSRARFRPRAACDVVPAEFERRIHPAQDDRSLTAGPAKQPRRPAAHHRPAGSFGETAPVRPDAGVARPPVRQVERLRDERPYVRLRREELPLGANDCQPSRVRARTEPLRQEVRRSAGGRAKRRSRSSPPQARRRRARRTGRSPPASGRAARHRGRRRGCPPP